MKLGDGRATNGVAAVLQVEDDNTVDRLLEPIKNEADGDDSDEEVCIFVLSPFYPYLFVFLLVETDILLQQCLIRFWLNSHKLESLFTLYHLSTVSIYSCESLS